MWLKNGRSLQSLFGSYAQSLSTRDSMKCRDLIKSKWYQALNPGFSISDDMDTKERFNNNKGGYRIATSVGGSGTGESCDIAVADDPHNMVEIDSRAIRQGVLDWFDGTFSTRGNDPKKFVKVVVMQRGHQKDVSGHILAQHTGFTHLCLPAEYTGSSKVTSLGWKDPRTVKGELLWPERFGAIEIERMKKALGSRKASGQLQQTPADEEGALVKLKWFNGKFYRQLPNRFDEKIISWDMSFKDNEDNDYVVGQCWGRLGADKYLIDQVRAIADFTTSLEMVKNFSAKHSDVYTILIEDKANGPAIISSLKKKIPGIIAVNPEGSKISRLNSVSPDMEAGNVYLPDSSIAPWIGDYLTELTTFPAVEHDDQVDATSQALNRFRDKTAGDFSEKMVPKSNSTSRSIRGKPKW
jgi:predicted phage terminase large subunit-like protein